jgi:hypothetical protein
MKKENNILEEVEIFEKKHKLAFFTIIIFTTIVFARIGVAIYDPNIIIGSVELHHFYYGIILLIFTNILLIFKKGSQKQHILLSGIAIGLILDEIVFIAGKIRSNIEYPETLIPTIITIAATILIAEIILSIYKRKK